MIVTPEGNRRNQRQALMAGGLVAWRRDCWAGSPLLYGFCSG